MNQNNNPQNNNDLDSLLKEFQTLSDTPTDPDKQTAPVLQSQPVDPMPASSTQPVVNPVPVSGGNVAGIDNSAVIPEPVMTTQIKDIPSPHNASVSPVQSGESQMPDPIMNPGGNVNLNSGNGNIVPPEEPPVQTFEKPIDSQPKEAQVDKNSNLFIIVIFLIIGVFIFFIPKISDFLSNKPRKETKPTATPVVTATATPTSELKEQKLTCTMPEVVVNDMNSNQTIYRYHSKGGKVTKLERVFKNVFTTVDDANTASYTETKNTCDTLATKYAGITGYTVACEEKDNTFTVTYAYDLEHFVNPTEIIVGTETEKIESPAIYGDKIETVKEKMEAAGATCK